MPSRSGLARDARPPGPIAIVQSYGTVWSTEQQDPKQDLRASDEEPSAVWSTRARNRTGNAELQSPRSENLTAKHSRLRRPCTAPPVIASYNNRRCHNKNKNVKTKMSQHFFPGSRPGCDRPFFSQLSEERNSCYFLRGLFLHKKNWIRSSFSCFDRTSPFSGQPYLFCPGDVAAPHSIKFFETPHRSRIGLFLIPY